MRWAYRSLKKALISSVVREAPRRRAMTTSYPRVPWPQKALQKSYAGSAASSGPPFAAAPWYSFARDVVDWDRAGTGATTWAMVTATWERVVAIALAGGRVMEEVVGHEGELMWSWSRRLWTRVCLV